MLILRLLSVNFSDRRELTPDNFCDRRELTPEYPSAGNGLYFSVRLSMYLHKMPIPL